MSSLDIAELTGKRHDHVMRDIKRVLEDLELSAPKFGAVYRDAKGEQRPCFHLPKDLTMTLCAGYSTPLRHRIVTRWMELERVVVTQDTFVHLRLSDFAHVARGPSNPFITNVNRPGPTDSKL